MSETATTCRSQGLRAVFMLCPLWMGAVATVQGAEPTTETQAVIPSVFYATDSDRFRIEKRMLSLTPKLTDPSHLSKWSFESRQYSQDSWRLATQHVGFSIKNEDPYGLGYQASITLNELDNTHILTTENRVGWRLSSRSVAEVLFVKDLVESQLGLTSERTYLLLGGSIETQWHPRLSAVSYLDMRHFSDENQRYTAKIKVIYDVLPSHGVTLQSWYQNFRNSDTDASESAYFNPSRYEETLMVVGVRKRISDLSFRFRIGAGTQQVAQVGPSRAQFTDLIAEKTDTRDWNWRLTAGYRLSAGTNGDANYRYRYGSLEVIIPFN